MFSIIVTLFIILLIVGFTIHTFKKHKKCLPGPRGFPLIGNIHQLDKQVHESFGKWSKQYGGIYSIRLALNRFVIVGDLKMAKEMLHDSAFSGRSLLTVFDFYDDGNRHGIVKTDGKYWEQSRRFTLRNLKDFGFGKQSMESCIMDEVNELLDRLKLTVGQPIENIKDLYTLATANSLLNIIGGKRYEQDDPRLLSLANGFRRSMMEIYKTGILVFTPWIRHFIPKLSGYTTFRQAMDEIFNFFSDSVTNHKNSLDEDHNRDLIDVWIKEIKQTEDPTSVFHGDFGEKQLIASLSDLFIAGSDTTSTTLSWLLLYLATFPEVQTKLQQEIQNITGDSRQCCVSDRSSMPYAEAVIAEVLRYSSIVPMGVQHRALYDKEFRGFLIPKDTLIMFDLYHIHHNPEIWGDPENFRPERFLSSDGKTFKKHDGLIAFSTGARQCLGESLARDNLFLFMTNTFQRFNVGFNPSKPQPNLEPAVGFILHPQPFDVILSERFD